MSYTVEYLRFTLECDACGLVEKREMGPKEETHGTAGWSEVRTVVGSFFCCSGCEAAVLNVLLKRKRAADEAMALLGASAKQDLEEYTKRKVVVRRG